MKNKLLILAVLVIASIQGQAQLTVTSGNPVNAIVDSLVGTGVTVSNITYTGNASARGLFSCAGGCNLGIAKGIFLSTGNAGQTPTSPPSDFHSTDLGASGDAQLNMIVSPLLTQDAAVLEFDFTPAADSIGFRFVFGSEEYNEFVNAGFNDVFAFYISGPGIVGSKNLALIPSTTIPVSIDNVNNGNSGGVATGPCTNCAYYTDNVANGGGAIFFDGFTHVINAGTAVQPCQTYHMKFAIADVGDGIYDSGVFLEAKSFTSIGHLNLYVNGVPSTSDTIYACHGDSVILSTSSTSSNITWNNGATTQTIVVTEANITTTGVYQYAVINGAALCFASSRQVKIIFVTPTATITPIGSLNLCPGGSVDLQANAGNSYLWSTGETTQTITVSTAGTYTVTVFVTPTCFASDSISVTVAAPTAAISGVTTICSGQATTLTANTGNSYIWSNGATTQSITVNSATTYTVTVTYPGGCTASASVAVNTNTNPTPSITGNNSICQGQSSILNAGSYTSYQWSTGSTSANISANTSGIYTVTVTDANGCTASTTFNLTVNPNPSPAITGTTAFCQGANSTLSAGGGYTNYQWSTGAVTPTLNVTTGGTYSVTVTNAAGCTATTNTVVTVNPNPTPSISGTTAFCTGASTTLNVGGTYPQYQWSTGSSANSITVTTANTFSVTVTDANGCTGTTSATTTINPLPTPSITGNNSICQGQSSILNAGSYTSYLWSTGSTSANISANTSGIYTVTVTDANGCTASTTFNLTVNPNPTPAITGTTAFCQGANSTLSAGGGYASYLWSTGAVTPTLNVTTGGTYSVTVTNGYGCSASASLPITVYSLPAPVINGPAGICPGASAALTTGSFATYVWSTGSNSQTINTTVPGTYAVTVTDANGCVDSVSYTLAAYTNPTPVITGTAAICQNQSSLLDAGSFASYNWSTGASTQTISVTQSGTYSVTVTNSTGCSATASFAVLVNPLPSPAITGINAFCNGDSSQLTVSGNYPSYLWSTGASSSAVTVNAGGNYVVTVTDANGCTASASQSITVWSLPSPVIAGDNNICIGESATLTTGNYASYQWSTGASTDSITTITAGNYVVTVTDMNGCVNTSAPFNIAVHQLPSAMVSGTTAICIGQSTPVQIDITGTPPFRYGYTDGSTAFGPFTTSNSTVTIPVAPTSATTYTLNLITDLYCNGNFNGTAAITVNPLPQPVITGPSSICENETAMLNAGAFAAYQWSTGEITAFINANTNGNYTCTVTSTEGCVNTANFYLTVNPLPVVSFTNDSSLTCEVPRIHFTNASVYPAGSVFNWNFGDAVSSEMNPVHQYDSSGTYPVTLNITTPAGCVDSVTQNVEITIFPLPLAQFDVSPDFAPLYNSTIELKNNSENAVTWHWDFGDGQKTDIPVSQYQFQSPGKYTITLQITNIAGCESVTSREVFITPFFVPNAFTPNGDGKNETFYDPGYAFDVSSVTMRIWNRWGQMVFSSDNMSHVWDGKDVSGNDAPQGVYYYTLKVVQNSGHENDYAGSVTLVR